MIWQCLEPTPQLHTAWAPDGPSGLTWQGTELVPTLDPELTQSRPSRHSESPQHSHCMLTLVHKCTHTIPPTTHTHTPRTQTAFTCTPGHTLAPNTFTRCSLSPSHRLIHNLTQSLPHHPLYTVTYTCSTHPHIHKHSNYLLWHQESHTHSHNHVQKLDRRIKKHLSQDESSE